MFNDPWTPKLFYDEITDQRRPQFFTKGYFDSRGLLSAHTKTKRIILFILNLIDQYFFYYKILLRSKKECVMRLLRG